jgi:hypothetical protein
MLAAASIEPSRAVAGAIEPAVKDAGRREYRASITIGQPVRPERYRDRREPHLAWRPMIGEACSRYAR